MTTPTVGYRTPARLFHWSVAVLVLLMIPAGALMVQEGLDRSTQNALYIFHKNTGLLVFALVIGRLIYRWLRPPVLTPIAMPGWQARASHLTHVALYGLLLIMPIAGYIRVKAGGFPIESLDAAGIPSLVPRSDALASFAQQVHNYGAYAIAGLVALHIGAAAFHGIVRRDGVFSRMWPPVAKRSS